MKLIFILLFCSIGVTCLAQVQGATVEDGRKVFLYKSGTWSFELGQKDTSFKQPFLLATSDNDIQVKLYKGGKWESPFGDRIFETQYIPEPINLDSLSARELQQMQVELLIAQNKDIKRIRRSHSFYVVLTVVSLALVFIGSLIGAAG